MKRFFLILWLTGLSISWSLGQDHIDNEPVIPFPRPRHWVIKFAPLCLYDYSNTIELGVERFIGAHQSVQVEFGYGWQNLNAWSRIRNSSYTNYEVWRGRAEWRFYWRQRNAFFNRSAPFGAYTALEGLYRQENAIEHGTVGVGDPAFQPTYYQLYSAPVTKQVWAATLKIGRQFPMSRNQRLVGDFYAGIGIRNRTITVANRPDGFVYPTSDIFSLNSYSSNLYTNIKPLVLNLALGFKIGYSF